MKKLIALLCALSLTFSLAACASAPKEDPKEPVPEVVAPEEEETPEVETPANPVEDMTLADIMAAMEKDVETLPAVGPMELTEENFEMFAFIPYAEGLEGYVSEAMIGAMAHSAVLIRVTGDQDPAEVAAQITENLNPRKWICVEAEKSVVRQYGNTIALVMSWTQTANQMISNFDALNGSETPEEDVFDPNAVVTDDPAGDMDGMGMDDLGPAVGELPAADPTEEPVVEPTVAPEPTPAPVEPTPAPVAPTPAPVEPTPAPVEPEVPAVPEEPAVDDCADLVAVMDGLLAGTDPEKMPMMAMTMPLTSDMFQMFTFIPYADGLRAVAHESGIGSMAYSTVLVEVPAGGDVADVASQIKANVNPAKWVCVAADMVEVATNGNYVLLVMADSEGFGENANIILSNFKNM